MMIYHMTNFEQKLPLELHGNSVVIIKCPFSADMKQAEWFDPVVYGSPVY